MSAVPAPDLIAASAPPLWLVELVAGVVLIELAAGAAMVIRNRLRRRAARRRAVQVGTSARRSGAGWAGKCLPRRRTGRPIDRAVALSLLGGAAVAWLVPGVLGLPAGLVTAVLLRRCLPAAHPSNPSSRSREDNLLLAQLPLTADLLAACLGSTASPAQAAQAVARTVGEPMEHRLSAVAAELALGASPAVCWERFGQDSAALGSLARCLIRTTLSGSPPAVPLQKLAASHRGAAQRAAQARVKRAGVLAAMPLGLCFLPAFVAIGIVPVVVGLVATFSLPY